MRDLPPETTESALPPEPACRAFVRERLPVHGGELSEAEVHLTDVLCADGFPGLGIIDFLFRRRKWRRLVAGLLRPLVTLSAKEVNYAFQLHQSGKSFEQIKAKIEGGRAGKKRPSLPDPDA